tara:strand:- start:145 stop:705 length:561 start_codon:yes stop_codon:yes gene_type:complete
MRIVIIGAPGSGKSTLAARLAQALELPCESLDTLNFNRKAGRIQVAGYEQRVARAKGLADESQWLCEGNYLGWVDPLFERASMIVHLQGSLLLSLRRVLWRHTVLSVRGTNPYPSWVRLVRFCYYIVMQHLNRLEPYTELDVPLGPASTLRELAPHAHKVLRVAAALPTAAQVSLIRQRLGGLVAD